LGSGSAKAIFPTDFEERFLFVEDCFVIRLLGGEQVIDEARQFMRQR
jgi:hypothetical protein